MDISVRLYEDAQSFSTAAGEFMLSRSVLHNLVLTIVDGRLRRAEPGRYWIAFRGGRVAGVVLQSPLTYPATVIPMDPDVIGALVNAIAFNGVVLPGVNGEAATAATFAGQWTERCKSAAFPIQGLRLYELVELNGKGLIAGELRNADAGDRDLAVAWLLAFYAETHTPESGAEAFIDASLASGHLWLWQADSVVSMAVSSRPIQGMTRVSAVYTPPENRKRGYAAACVYGVSKHFTEAGYRCILYTDLGNPISNSIYRQIGYRATAEAIQYRFDHID
jgi:predicted GNAT family acetyltransferase